jgi:uncharacterized protein
MDTVAVDQSGQPGDLPEADSRLGAFSRIRVWHFLVVLVVGMILMGVADVCLLGLGLPLEIAVSISEVLLYLFFCAYLWGMGRETRLDYARLVGPRWRFRTNLLWPLIMIPLVVASRLLLGFNWFPGTHPLPEAQGAYTSIDLALQVFMILVLAPVAEEIIFRGIILQRAAMLMGNTRAIIVTSVAFALMHAVPLAIFAFAVLLSLLYIRTGSLLITMAAHALYNVFPILALFNIHPLAVVSARDGFSHVVQLLCAAVIGCCVWKLWPGKEETLPYFRGGVGDILRSEFEPMADSNSGCDI